MMFFGTPDTLAYPFYWRASGLLLPPTAEPPSLEVWLHGMVENMAQSLWQATAPTLIPRGVQQQSRAGAPTLKATLPAGGTRGGRWAHSVLDEIGVKEASDD